MKQDRSTAIGFVAEAINRALGETKGVTIVLENMVRFDASCLSSFLLSNVLADLHRSVSLIRLVREMF